MRCQIDQSGKIEQTNKDTVLCLSNDTWDSVLIKAKTKRQIQEIYRRNGQIKNYILFTFSAGLSVLIKRIIKANKTNEETITNIAIDREYFGKDPVIKEILTEMLKTERKIPEIEFGHVGKESRAHFRAKLIADKKAKSHLVLSLENLFKAIKKTEVGKRLKDA